MANNLYGITIGLNPGCGNAASNYAFWTNLFADMKTLGLTWLRFQLSWCSIELTQGVYTWDALDDAVSQCNAAGINILYTLRGAPTWALTTASQKATTEPWYLPDPTLMAGFASAVATRYNGLSGHGKIDAFGYNEDFCLKHTSVTATLTLNQTLTSGVPVTSFTINASGFTPQIGTKLYFGTYSSTDVAIVSANVALNATTVSVNSFTPGSTYTAGQSIKIGYVGTYNSSYVLFNGINGVTTLNKPEPARDAHFASPVIKAVTPAIRAANPGVPIGAPAIWWNQPAHIGGIPNTPVSIYTAFMQQLYTDGCKGLFDFIDFHYYSNGTDPAVGSNQTSTINQAVADLVAVAAANGDAGRAIYCTEFGWQVPTDTNSTLQATWYEDVLDAMTPGTSRSVFPFTLDYKTSGMSESSLVQWNGSIYTYQPAFTTYQNYIAAHPGTSGGGAYFVLIGGRAV